jgi:hypothetical protein
MNNLDYLNLNSLRNYPIKDGSSRVSEDGIFTIPNSLIVDMSLCSVGLDSPTLYISKIITQPAQLVIEISADGIGIFGTFSAGLDQNVTPALERNIDVILIPAAELFPNATGCITIGDVTDLVDLPYGIFTFKPEATELLMRVYGPTTPGLSWLSFTDTKGNKASLTGNVLINGYSNIKFRINGQYIYMDAGENLGLNKVCTTASNPITTINGIPGDPATGNFTLIPEQCVTLSAAQYGILIGDNCGQPCMGCTEIDTLTTQVNSLESSIIDIRNFVNNLQLAINQASTLLNYQCQCD